MQQHKNKGKSKPGFGIRIIKAIFIAPVIKPGEKYCAKASYMKEWKNTRAVLPYHKVKIKWDQWIQFRTQQLPRNLQISLVISHRTGFTFTETDVMDFNTKIMADDLFDLRTQHCSLTDMEGKHSGYLTCTYTNDISCIKLRKQSEETSTRPSFNLFSCIAPKLHVSKQHEISTDIKLDPGTELPEIPEIRVSEFEEDWVPDEPVSEEQTASIIFETNYNNSGPTSLNNRDTPLGESPARRIHSHAETNIRSRQRGPISFFSNNLQGSNRISTGNKFGSFSGRESSEIEISDEANDTDEKAEIKNNIRVSTLKSSFFELNELNNVGKMIHTQEIVLGTRLMNYEADLRNLNIQKELWGQGKQQLITKLHAADRREKQELFSTVQPKFKKEKTKSRGIIRHNATKSAITNSEQYLNARINTSDNQIISRNKSKKNKKINKQRNISGGIIGEEEEILEKTRNNKSQVSSSLSKMVTQKIVQIEVEGELEEQGKGDSLINNNNNNKNTKTSTKSKSFKMKRSGGSVSPKQKSPGSGSGPGHESFETPKKDVIENYHKMLKEKGTKVNLKGIQTPKMFGNLENSSGTGIQNVGTGTGTGTHTHSHSHTSSLETIKKSTQTAQNIPQTRSYMELVDRRSKTPIKPVFRLKEAISPSYLGSTIARKTIVLKPNHSQRSPQSQGGEGGMFTTAHQGRSPGNTFNVLTNNKLWKNYFTRAAEHKGIEGEGEGEHKGSGYIHPPQFNNTCNLSTPLEESKEDKLHGESGGKKHVGKIRIPEIVTEIGDPLNQLRNIGERAGALTTGHMRCASSIASFNNHNNNNTNNQMNKSGGTGTPENKRYSPKPGALEKWQKHYETTTATTPKEYGELEYSSKTMGTMGTVDYGGNMDQILDCKSPQAEGITVGREKVKNIIIQLAMDEQLVRKRQEKFDRDKKRLEKEQRDIQLLKDRNHFQRESIRDIQLLLDKEVEVLRSLNPNSPTVLKHRSLSEHLIPLGIRNHGPQLHFAQHQTQSISQEEVPHVSHGYPLSPRSKTIDCLQSNDYEIGEERKEECESPTIQRTPPPDIRGREFSQWEGGFEGYFLLQGDLTPRKRKPRNYNYIAN